MSLIHALLFLFRHYSSVALLVSPFADPPDNNASIFTQVESLLGRPLWDWDTVRSCLLTTITVIQVSVRPNAPQLKERGCTLLDRRFLLMGLALLAPEVMIILAFRQWLGALIVREEINKARPKSCPEWTMTHAHFLQMGGYRLNYIKGELPHSVSYGHEVEKKGVVMQECVLDFDILKFILTNRLIMSPNTTAREIEMSTASEFVTQACALVLVVWFTIQLIVRTWQHLTITLLELSTASLIGLNGIVYLFWWYKPFDVRQPIVLCTRKLEEELKERFMLNLSDISSTSETWGNWPNKVQMV